MTETPRDRPTELPPTAGTADKMKNMIRTILTFTVASLFGLAMLGCFSPRKSNADDQLAPATTTPGHEIPEDAQPTEKHTRDHAAHGDGQSHDGPGGNHRDGMPPHVRNHQQQEGAAQRLGQEVRDFAVTDNTGKAFRLEMLRRTQESGGRIAVLTFWCTTCSSCRGIEREFEKKAAEYREEGVQFLMVDSNFTDNAERVNQFLKARDLSLTVLMDSESAIARYFGAKLTTTTAVIDADGRLRYYGRFGGAENAVRNLLAGEEVVVPETPGTG